VRHGAQQLPASRPEPLTQESRLTGGLGRVQAAADHPKKAGQASDVDECGNEHGSPFL